MADPLVDLAIGIGRFLGPHVRRAIGSQMGRRACGVAAAGAVQEGMDKLRDQGVNVPTAVEIVATQAAGMVATQAAGMAGSQVGARLAAGPSSSSVSQGSVHGAPEGPASVGRLLPIYGYRDGQWRSGPRVPRVVAEPPERTHPYQGPEPMIKPVVIEPGPPLTPPPPPPSPPIQYGSVPPTPPPPR